MSKTLMDLLSEMKSFVNDISEEDLEKAEKRILKPSQAHAVNDLKRDWVNGVYDEAPEQLVKELKYFL